MSSEKSLRRQVAKGLAPYGDVEQIENLCEQGTPDTNVCINGVEVWIELKQLDRWPAREMTVVRIDHYTKAQKMFGARRIRNGGKWCLLIQIGNEYLLYRGACGLLVGTLTKQEMLSRMTQWWRRSIDFDHLVKLITSEEGYGHGLDER